MDTNEKKLNALDHAEGVANLVILPPILAKMAKNNSGFFRYGIYTLAGLAITKGIIWVYSATKK